MTSQRMIEDFAHWLWHRDIVVPGLDVERNLFARVPDSYLNEAAVFLAGELGQQLQRAREIEALLSACESAERRSMDGRGQRLNTHQIRDLLDGAS